MKTMSRTRIVAFTLAALLAAATVTLAQESKKQPAGSVTGRVTLAGKPMARVVVLLTPTDPRVVGIQNVQPLRAITDDEGRYRLSGIEPGNYRVLPHTPALVSDGAAELNQTVSIADGDEADDIDFSLRRGGVISGRVVDAEGKPVIGQRIDLTQVDERGRRMPNYGSSGMMNPNMFTSDDRGVYRLYGLFPGHYKVSMGQDPERGMVRMGYGGANYSRTFHPDVTDEAKARIIELTAGGEVTGVDITMGRPAKTYSASGRIIDAESGMPVSDLRYGYGALGPDQRLGGYGTTNNRSNSNGEFRIEGLSPGRYSTFVMSDGQSEFYSEPAIFDVTGTDVSQIEIKVRRGASISGVAALEGTDDPEISAKLSKLGIAAFVMSQEMSVPSSSTARIGPDGGFRVAGLKPGKVRMQLANYPPVKGLVLLRVEREGVEQRDGVEVGPGESVSGVRLVIGYGTGTIRGQVKIEGGEKPPNARLMVFTRRQNSPESFGGGTVQVDARGRFTIEGLLPGDYEVVARLMVLPPPPSPNAPRAAPTPPFPPVTATQNVQVANGAEMEVTLVLNLAAKDKDKDQDK